MPRSHVSHRMRACIGYGVVFMAVFAVSAQEQADRKAVIGDFGVFEPVGGEVQVALPQSTSGAKKTPSGIRFVERTRMVPTRRGVRFGFKYEISGARDRKPVEVMVIVSHPAIQKPDGSVSKGFKFKERIPVVDGKARGFTGYSFDHDYELVQGEWKFEFWIREGKILEWTFVACREDQDRTYATSLDASPPLPLYENRN